MDMLFFLRTTRDYDPAQHALNPQSLTHPMVGAALLLQGLTMAVAAAMAMHPSLAQPTDDAATAWALAFVWCVVHGCLGSITTSALGRITGTPPGYRPHWAHCALMLALVNSGLMGLAFFVTHRITEPLKLMDPDAALYLTAMALGCGWLGIGMVMTSLQAHATLRYLNYLQPRPRHAMAPPRLNP